MSQEIIFTSAPQGLKAGSRGFCTVVSTPGMAVNLAERLESLSGYRHAFMPHEAQAVNNPVNFSHLIVSLGGRRYHVLSRVADAGLDYTQRSNKLAHHVALEAAEAAAAPGGPAWVLADPEFCVAKWDGKTRIIPSGHLPRSDNCPTGVCEFWQKAAGDAGWAGVLAESTQAPANQPRYVIFPVGMSVLPLVTEALSLLPPARRWEVSFCTYFTKLPAGLECKWRFVLDGSAEADALRRNPHSDAIDLCVRLPAAKGGELVALARSGKARLPVESAPSTGRAAPPSLVGASRHRLGAAPPALEVEPLAPPFADPPLAPSVATRGFSASYSGPTKTTSPDSRRNLALMMAIAALVPVAGSLVFAGFLAGKNASVPVPVARESSSSDDSRQAPAAITDPPVQVDRNKPKKTPTDDPPDDRDRPSSDDSSMESVRRSKRDQKARGPRNSQRHGDEHPGQLNEPFESPAVPPAAPDSESTPPLPATASAPPPPTAEPPQSPPPIQRDPFEDIVARHHLLKLPDPPGVSRSNETKELAKLYVSSPADVSLKLMGADIAFGSGRGTTLRPVPKPQDGESASQSSAATWQLLRLKAGGTGRDEIIGRFEIADQSLSFTWERQPSSTAKPERLRFALLEISVGNLPPAICRFVDPIEHPVAGVSLATAYTWSVTVPLKGWDHLASEDRLRLEVTPSGFPRQQALGQPVLKLKQQPGDTDRTMITMPSAEAPNDKALELTVTFRDKNKDSSKEKSPEPELHVESKMFPILDKTQKHKREFEPGYSPRLKELRDESEKDDFVSRTALKKAQKDLDDWKRNQDPLPGAGATKPMVSKEEEAISKKMQKLNEELAFIAKQTKWITSLQNDLAQIHSHARIDFTLFFEIEGRRIELLRSVPGK